MILKYQLCKPCVIPDLFRSVKPLVAKNPRKIFLLVWYYSKRWIFSDF